MTNGALLEIADLAVSFDADGERFRAVNGVSLTIHPHQTLALVGESGCGKSVTALSILRLLPRPAARIDRGSIRFGDRDLLSLTEKQMMPLRGGEIAMIFQEPMTSLNPVYSIGDQIIEAVRLHQKVRRRQAAQIAVRAMSDVGIPDAQRRLESYPHQFSGGMRQRAMIAMALACEPRLLLADEPTTALDVTIQAQILELLAGIQRSRGLAVMLITHDLGVVAEYADVVCVMYAGRAIEYATVHDLFEKAYHPYTRGLFASIPRLGEAKRRLTTIDDVVSDPDEFRSLPGHDEGVIPWWPKATPPDDAAKSAGESVLYEVEPGHWVGCRRTEHLAERASGRPDLDFRRKRSLHPSVASD